MGLDDREQRILAEIERQFYKEDPDLADAVRNISRKRASRGQVRVAIFGAVAGFVLLLWSFTSSTALASVGFLILVASVFVIVQAKRPASPDSVDRADAHSGD